MYFVIVVILLHLYFTYLILLASGRNNAPAVYSPSGSFGIFATSVFLREDKCASPSDNVPTAHSSTDSLDIFATSALSNNVATVESRAGATPFAFLILSTFEIVFLYVAKVYFSLSNNVSTTVQSRAGASTRLCTSSLRGE